MCAKYVYVWIADVWGGGVVEMQFKFDLAGKFLLANGLGEAFHTALNEALHSATAAAPANAQTGSV